MTLPERATPGEPLRYPADFFNLQIDMAEAFQQRHTTADGPRFRVPTGQVVYVKNETASDLDQFSALRIVGILFSASDREIEFKSNWAFKGNSTGTDADPLCVFQQPVKAGKIAPAMIDGMSPAKLNIIDNTVGFAILDTSVTTGRLKTDSYAGAEIIYKGGSSGNVWAIVRLGRETKNVRPLIRFTLAAALATTDENKTATITNQYGPGVLSTSTGAGAITVHNLLTSAGGVYVFEGDSGDAGWALWDSTTHYQILNMECP